jgi:hypothetical protein
MNAGTYVLGSAQQVVLGLLATVKPSLRSIVVHVNKEPIQTVEVATSSYEKDLEAVERENRRLPEVRAITGRTLARVETILYTDNRPEGYDTTQRHLWEASTHLEGIIASRGRYIEGKKGREQVIKREVTRISPEEMRRVYDTITTLNLNGTRNDNPWGLPYSVVRISCEVGAHVPERAERIVRTKYTINFESLTKEDIGVRVEQVININPGRLEWRNNLREDIYTNGRRIGNERTKGKIAKIEELKLPFSLVGMTKTAVSNAIDYRNILSQLRA